MTRPTVDMDDDDLKEWLGITGTNSDVEKKGDILHLLKNAQRNHGKSAVKVLPGNA